MTQLPKEWTEKIEADADCVWSKFQSVYIAGATPWAEQCFKLMQALYLAINELQCLNMVGPLPYTEKTGSKIIALNKIRVEFEAFLKEGVE